ncbi:hypothetical protein EDD21DRAFT_227886 [Dissophora ornata]|nr:hypothetical protein EDD21DRAFT_227886 [Dissophora ornata]
MVWRRACAPSLSMYAIRTRRRSMWINAPHISNVPPAGGCHLHTYFLIAKRVKHSSTAFSFVYILFEGGSFFFLILIQARGPAWGGSFAFNCLLRMFCRADFGLLVQSSFEARTHVVLLHAPFVYLLFCVVFFPYPSRATCISLKFISQLLTPSLPLFHDPPVVRKLYSWGY